MNEDKFKKIVSHAKEFGFVFPSSEIYDGLSATYDYLNAITTLNNERFTWGDGDSIDRERVRDFLVRNYGYSTDFDGGSLWALDQEAE